MSRSKDSYKRRVSYHSLLGKQKAKAYEVLGIGGQREAQKLLGEYKLDLLEQEKQTGQSTIELAHTAYQIGSDKKFRTEEAPAVAERLAQSDYESHMYGEWKESNKDVKIQDQKPFESDWSTYKTTDAGQEYIGSYMPDIPGKLTGIWPGGEKWDYGRRIIGNPSYEFGGTSLKKSQISAMYQKIEAENLLEAMSTESAAGADRYKGYLANEYSKELQEKRGKGIKNKGIVQEPKTKIKNDLVDLSFTPSKDDIKPLSDDAQNLLDRYSNPNRQNLPSKVVMRNMEKSDSFKKSDPSTWESLYPSSKQNKFSAKNLMDEVRATASIKTQEDIDFQQKYFKDMGADKFGRIESTQASGEGYIPYSGQDASQNIDILQYAVREKTPAAFNFSYNQAHKGTYDTEGWTIRGQNENLDALERDDPIEFSKRNIQSGAGMDVGPVNLKGMKVHEMWEKFGFGKWDETKHIRQDMLTKMHHPGSYYAPNPKKMYDDLEEDKLSKILASR